MPRNSVKRERDYLMPKFEEIASLKFFSDEFCRLRISVPLLPRVTSRGFEARQEAAPAENRFNRWPFGWLIQFAN